MAINPFADLAEEHGGIMVMLEILGAVAKKQENGWAIPPEHLTKIFEFLKNFVDKCHHGKEEGILFPALANLPQDQLAINDLLAEHRAGRELVRKMVESPDGLAAPAGQFIQLLTDHIHKENTQFFPLAETQLSPEIQQQIADRFDALERDIIGPGKHEEYHGWLAELRQIYLLP